MKKKLKCTGCCMKVVTQPNGKKTDQEKKPSKINNFKVGKKCKGTCNSLKKKLKISSKGKKIGTSLTHKKQLLRFIFVTFILLKKKRMLTH